MDGSTPPDTDPDVEAALNELREMLDADGYAWVDADGTSIHIDFEDTEPDYFPVKQADEAREEARYFIGKAISSLQLAGDDDAVEALDIEP